jgi:hypothetical protein
VHIGYNFDPKATLQRPPSLSFLAQWFFNKAEQSFRPAARTTPLRAEREIEVFGREWLGEHFANTATISLPCFLFVHGFGLFRNMSWAIEEMYLMPQYLAATEREKLSSLIPLTLGPFGSSKVDIYKALGFLHDLEAGKDIIIDGQHVFVCALIAAFVSDVVEQQELSSCLSITPSTAAGIA